MLPDLLQDGLKVVFCGTAAGNRSAQLQLYYAKPSNKFWRTLYQVGLTPNLLDPKDYQQLLTYGIGLTDLVKKKAGMDKLLSQKDFEYVDFHQKIEKFQPKVVCFNGKRAATEYFGHPVVFGKRAEQVGITEFFVAPSTSGAANGYWDIGYWHTLAKWVKSL